MATAQAPHFWDGFNVTYVVLALAAVGSAGFAFALWRVTRTYTDSTKEIARAIKSMAAANERMAAVQRRDGSHQRDHGEWAHADDRDVAFENTVVRSWDFTDPIDVAELDVWWPSEN